MATWCQVKSIDDFRNFMTWNRESYIPVDTT